MLPNSFWNIPLVNLSHFRAGFPTGFYMFAIIWVSIIDCDFSNEIQLFHALTHSSSFKKEKKINPLHFCWLKCHNCSPKTVGLLSKKEIKVQIKRLIEIWKQDDDIIWIVGKIAKLWKMTTHAKQAAKVWIMSITHLWQRPSRASRANLCSSHFVFSKLIFRQEQFFWCEPAAPIRCGTCVKL